MAEIPGSVDRRFRRFGFWLVVSFLAGSFSASVTAQHPADPADRSGDKADGPGDKVQLTQRVADLRQEYKLVGLGAMVMVDSRIVASAVDGERQKGSGVKLEIGDRWHIGSITKSITATMIARQVEAEKMQWADTVGDCFRDAEIHDDWKSVTIRQLLTHTAGAPRDFSVWLQFQSPEPGVECRKARRKAVLEIIATKPTHPPGQQFAYSNVGYTIAGAMAEELTGLAWSNLVKREVFEPLKLEAAGFGPPRSSDGKISQPRGHVPFLFGSKIAQDEDADNTTIIGPAGIVHMTLRDLCVYASEHLRGACGKGILLATETWKLLHTPEKDNYACGWMKKDTAAEVPHEILWHNGSNTKWFALVAFVPDKNMVVAVTSNDGDIPAAEGAAWEIVSAYTPTDEYPKKSPFAAVRWKELKPEVRLEKEWFQLISVNDVPTEDILIFSRKEYGRQWQMRIEEDLVEILIRMRHKPQKNVKLVVQSLASGEQYVREDVPMTIANREAIKSAASTRSLFDQSPEQRQQSGDAAQKQP